MKISKYTFFFKSMGKSNSWILYNSFSNNLAEINDEELKQIKECLSGKKKGIDQNLENNLIRGGFFVSDSKSKK